MKSDYDLIIDKMNQNVTRIKLLQQNCNKIVGLIGATGSGKSTLTCYLLQAPIGYQKATGGRFHIHPTLNPQKYPQIGHKAKSCTDFPTCYQVQGQSFVDLTGWFDTSSTNQQIINAFSNSAIFKKGKQVKIMVVVQISSLINQRGGNFVKIVQRLAQFFQGDFMLMLNSTLLVLSKVNLSDWTLDAAKKQIAEIIENNDNLNILTKTFLQSLLKSDNIAFMPNPDKIQDYPQQIKRKLKSIRSLTLTNDGNVSLSHEAKNSVNKHIVTLNKTVSDLSKDISQQIRNRFPDMNIFKDGVQVNQQLNKMKKVKTILHKQLGKVGSMRAQIQVLNDLKRNLGLPIQKTKQLQKNFNAIAFFKEINGNINIKSNFVQTISLETQQLISKLEIRRSQLTSEEDRKKMEEAFRVQMQKRQIQNNQRLEQYRKNIQQMNQATQKRLNQQKQFFSEMMKQSDQKHQENINLMMKTIKQLQDRPPQIIHVNSGQSGGCQIM